MSIDSTLDRRMTIEKQTPPKSRFVPVMLPWLIAVAALVVYLITLNHWLSFNSLSHVARVSGWTWQPELYEPVYWLVTYPFRWLPAKSIPLALNLLSLACAGLTLALLARSVALLPHDRTPQQRQREQGAFSLLSIRTAWLPPVLAALVCGLQLTFWEHATAASVEMLNLLIFAYVIRCLLEFRIDERESWLTRAALVYGLGITNNWAMIAFFPLFLAALIWIRGVSFFNLRFLSRMFLCGALGLSLYLLLPLVQSRAGFSTVPFWMALKANLSAEKNFLASIFSKYQLFQTENPLWTLALFSLVPMLLIAIRWPSSFGDTSELGAGLTTLMLNTLLAVLFLFCIWIAWDPSLSPRTRLSGLVPGLTLYYLGALSIGYLSGYFLLVFTPKPERSRRKSSYLRLIDAVSTLLIWLLLIIAPTVLVYKNLPQIRTTNGSMFQEFARLVLDTLPAKDAVVLCDEPSRLLLVQAAAAQVGREKALVFVDSGSVNKHLTLEYLDYHRFLRNRYGSRWPADAPKGAKGLINPLVMMPIFSQLQQTNSLFYLHPSFGFYFERFYLEPHGLVYKLLAYPATNSFPPTLSNDLITDNETFWSTADGQTIKPLLAGVAPPLGRSQSGLMDRFIQKARLTTEKNRDASILARFYSRARDYWAVELQKRGQLEKAAAHFEQALDLNPDNIAAQVSLECNKRLRAGQTTPVKSTALEESFGKFRPDWDRVLGENGPYDDPTACWQQGQLFVQGKLFRQALHQFVRSKELDPTHLSTRLWLTQLYIVARQPEEALKQVKEIHKENRVDVNRTNLNELLFAEASAYLANKDGPGADAAIQKALQQFPNDKDVQANLLATASQTYMNFRFYSNALLTIGQQLKLTPDNVSALINKGFAHLQLNTFQEAIPPLTRVLELQTNNHSALINRGIAYLRNGQLEEARQDYETLQKIAPTAYPVYYGLQEIAYRKQDTNAAIHYCELYLSNNPSNPNEIKDITNRLAELKKGPH